MRGNLSGRLDRLEGSAIKDTGVSYSLIRYSPPAGSSDWAAIIIEQLGWSDSTFALVVIDANVGAPAVAEEVIAPVHYDDMSNEDRTRYFAAGRDPGRWYLAVTGRGQPQAMPMFAGRAAFKADLVASIQRPQGGYFGA
jgi:hypothetical protein